MVDYGGPWPGNIVWSYITEGPECFAESLDFIPKVSIMKPSKVWHSSLFLKK